MIVTAHLLARPVDTTSFTDITVKECIRVGWNDAGQLEVQFAVNLTAEEAEQVRIRCLTTDATEEAIWRAAWNAMTTNRTFNALPTVTSAQLLAEVKALARQNNGIIRLLLAKTDATD